MTKKEKAQQYFIKATKAYDRGDYQAARNNYEKAIETKPNYIHAYDNLAYLLIDHFQDYKKARQYFEKVIELYPNDANAYNNLGILLMGYFHEPEKVKQNYKKAIELNPNDTNAYNNYALFLEDNHEYTKAWEYYEKAIEINPNFAVTYFNLGVYSDRYFQDYEQAKIYYEQAIKINPNFAEAYNNLADILNEHFSEHEKAKQYFEKTIKLNPNLTIAYNNLAILYYEYFKNSKKAQEYLMRSIEVDPSNDEIRKGLSKISTFNKLTFISEFEIKNVRHQKNINIKLSETNRKHLFLTGKNGSGKTSVLKEAENYMQRILEIPIKEIFTEKGKKEFWQDTDNYKLKFNVKQNLLDLRVKYEAGNYTIVFFDDERKFKPIIPENIENIELNSKYLPKEDVGKNFIKYLIHRDYMLKSNEESDNINELFEKIRTILKDIYKEEKLELILSAKELNFYIKLPNGNKFTFNQLSAGYSAIFKIIFEIILRTRSKENKTNTEGIILIDEPETHLHIEMQKEIMPILIKMFSNVQFVVATHSPFILNSVANAVVYDLETGIRTEKLSKIPLTKVPEYLKLNKEDVKKIETEIDEFINLVTLAKKGKITDKQGSRIADLDLKLNKSVPLISDDIFKKFKETQKELY